MRVAACLAFAIVVGVVQDAAAECADPTWIGTPENGVLPVRGSFFLYTEARDHRVEVRWNGEPGTLTETRVSDRVTRFDYDARGATGLELGPPKYPTKLRFDARWRAPTDAPRLVEYTHSEGKWTCSSWDTIEIVVDQPVAAFRVRWNGKESILPSWRRGTSRLVLGKINCGGFTIDPSELHEGGHLDLVAIRFDRSEVHVEGVPEPFVAAAAKQDVDDHDRKAILLIAALFLLVYQAGFCGFLVQQQIDRADAIVRRALPNARVVTTRRTY